MCGNDSIVRNALCGGSASLFLRGAPRITSASAVRSSHLPGLRLGTNGCDETKPQDTAFVLGSGSDCGKELRRRIVSCARGLMCLTLNGQPYLPHLQLPPR